MLFSLTNPEVAILMMGIFLFAVLLGFPIAFTLMAMGAAVSEADAAAKHRALEGVHAAFVFRENSSVEQPAAAEFVLADMCSAARRAKRTRGGETWPATATSQLVDGVPSRCLLGPRRLVAQAVAA